MTEEFTVEVSDNQATKIRRAADLFDKTPEEFVRDAIQNRLEAVSKFLSLQADRQEGEQ